jgi:ribose transport system ATP-binding protein
VTADVHGDVLAVELRHVSKAFAGQLALDDVSVTFAGGQITALLGANGSGKSTLIKILAGYHTPENKAEICVHGEQLPFGSPGASHAAGLRFIHQDLGLVDTLNVAENMTLSRAGDDLRWTSHRRERREVRQLLAKYGLDIDPARMAGSLRPSERSMVAIIRAVEDGLDSRGVLVLDEPTASLPQDEVQRLTDLLLELRRNGTAILYVTHRLPEVIAIADRICVLRDGKVVGDRTLAGLSRDDVLELILGRRMDEISPGDPATRDATERPVLELTNISGGNVRDVSVAVAAGEVVGIAGVVGSGYESLLGLAFGATARSDGEVVLEGELVSPQPSAAIRAGLAYVPPERRLGVIPSWTVRENMTLPKVKPSGRGYWMSARHERVEVTAWMSRLGITPSNPEAPLLNLSGGNQQKVVIARWLKTGARALMVDEPTLGVDVGAKRAIHNELRAAAASGLGVLVTSSDLEELCELCDRILVMGRGRIAADLPATVGADQLFAKTLEAASTV